MPLTLPTPPPVPPASTPMTDKDGLPTAAWYRYFVAKAAYDKAVLAALKTIP